MGTPHFDPSRRLFFQSAAAAAILPFWTVKGAFAEELVRTPSQTEGPFYPNKLPLDTDNDLITINDNITPGVGQITHLTGKVTEKGLTRDPLTVYLKNGFAKVELGIAKGRKLHDKREAIAEREAKRDQQRAMSERR